MRILTKERMTQFVPQPESIRVRTEDGRIHAPYKSLPSAGLIDRLLEVVRAVRAKDQAALDRALSVQTRDTVLTPPTDEEMAQYFAGRAKIDLGRVWDGFIQPMLEQMDDQTRDALMEQVSNYLESGPAESLAATGDDDVMGLGKAKPNSIDRRRTRDILRRPVTPDEINSANARFWEKRLSKNPTSDVRRVAATPESINEANRRLWGQA